MAELKNYKIRIPSPEISETVQKMANKKGYFVRNPVVGIPMDAEYIYLYADGDMTYGKNWDNHKFEKHRHPEILATDFLNDLQ